MTTIIFNGDPVAPRDFTKEATAQGYFPEWVIGASALVDTNAFARFHSAMFMQYSTTVPSPRLAPANIIQARVPSLHWYSFS